jgi:SAM-dependent methyltransferase
MQANPNDGTPSAWVTRYAPLIRAGGQVLDLACGAGRNARWLARQGWQVEAVDRDASALTMLHGVENVQLRQADLEQEPWPYAGRSFDGIVVCRYLHRPLFPLLLQCLAEQGVLIYETFMLGQALYGRPSNPDFLLKDNELLDYFGKKLEVVDFEQGVFHEPEPRALQRICLRNSRVATLHA